MHVISPKAIRDAKVTYPKASNALNNWLNLMEKNQFKNFAELKNTFGSVDKINDLYVFDIGGNNIRIIASIHFNRGKIYVRKVLTHKQYDKGNWKQDK